MNTIKSTKNIMEEPISKTASQLFSEFFKMQEKEIKKYSRSFLEPVFATNEPLKVVDYVLPFDADKTQIIEKEYELVEGVTLKLKFKKAVYKEVDSQGRAEYVTYLVPILKTDQLMKLRWQLNELNADLEPIAIAERVKSKEFQHLDIKDGNGLSLTGYALADEYLGIPTGNSVVDATKNEISSVKRINHATNVMSFERKKHLYKALYDLVTSPDKIKRTEGIESLNKLGVDILQVSNEDTVNKNSQPIIQGLTGGYQRYNPGVRIQPGMDSSIVQNITKGMGNIYGNQGPQPGGVNTGTVPPKPGNLKNRNK